jgi:hypothetical protein
MTNEPELSEYLSLDRLSVMIQAQKELQTKFGFTFSSMTLHERIIYIRDMVLSLSNELQAEVLQECSWKPWLTTDDNLFINDGAFFGELVDCWHFIMNLLLVIKPDLAPEDIARDFYRAYMSKCDVNAKRQAIGYDGISSKCAHCNRDVTDVVVHEIRGYDGKTIYICGGCDSELPPVVKTYLDQLDRM